MDHHEVVTRFADRRKSVCVPFDLPDCGARLTGSAGGLYDATLFQYVKSVPFNSNDPLECQLRLLPPNASEIKIPHIAYVGDGDPLVLHGMPMAEAEARRTNAPLTIVRVPGDHFASFGPSMKLYFQEVQKSVAAASRDKR